MEVRIEIGVVRRTRRGGERVLTRSARVVGRSVSGVRRVVVPLVRLVVDVVELARDEAFPFPAGCRSHEGVSLARQPLVLVDQVVDVLRKQVYLTLTLGRLVLQSQDVDTFSRMVEPSEP